jgi:hypothetical protein
LILELRKSGAVVFWHDVLIKEWIGEVSSNLDDDYDLIILANPHDGFSLRVNGNTKILDTRGGY